MTNPITLTYSPALVRQSVWAYWKRTVGITMPLVLVLLTAYLVMLIHEGSIGWTTGVLGSCVAMGYVFLVVVYQAHLGHRMATLNAMGTPHATLALDEVGFTLVSGAGEARLPWQGVKETWRYPGFWLLMLSRAQFITLPLDNLPESMQTEILERVRQHGGKVY